MEFVPGDTVPASGVYRVEHDLHRLMHEATLLVDTRFPRCKQCKGAVRFHLLRSVLDSQVLPFRGHAFLEEYPESEPPFAAVG
jgi:hypothetical protein